MMDNQLRRIPYTYLPYPCRCYSSTACFTLDALRFLLYGAAGLSLVRLGGGSPSDPPAYYPLWALLISLSALTVLLSYVGLSATDAPKEAVPIPISQQDDDDEDEDDDDGHNGGKEDGEGEEEQLMLGEKSRGGGGGRGGGGRRRGAGTDDAAATAATAAAPTAATIAVAAKTIAVRHVYRQRRLHGWSVLC
eukprot:COSAG06_NODE_1230_length_10161_cov_2.903498_10_plen_191_part_01